MTVENIKDNTERKKTVTALTKHIDQYSTAQFQTQAMIIDYTDLQNAFIITRLIDFIEKCSLRRARITPGNSKANSF